MNWKGVHHLYLGWLLAMGGLSGVGLGFALQSWNLIYVGLGSALLGLLYAIDDAIGDRFGIKTPVKAIDEWIKGRVGFYFNLCQWLDKIFKKNE